jgi:single-strand DNA-binding protein
MYHTIIIAGHLGRDPEMRHLESGQAVTNFSMASTRRWNGQDGEPREETAWFRVSVFGAQAEACQEYLGKGRAVLVEGRLRPDEDGNPRTWTGEDGVTRAGYDVVARSVRFLGRREAAASAEAPASPEEEIDEIPF